MWFEYFFEMIDLVYEFWSGDCGVEVGLVVGDFLDEFGVVDFVCICGDCCFGCGVGGEDDDMSGFIGFVWEDDGVVYYLVCFVWVDGEFQCDFDG